MTKTQRNEIVRSLPCCECGHPPRSQLAHSNNYKHGKGMGKKADDYYTIPLCDICHKDFDQRRRREGFDYDGWFIERLEFVNEVIDVKQAKDREPAF